MRVLIVTVGFVFVVAACEPEVLPLCESTASLVDPAAWTFVAPEADTLWPAPAGSATCGPEDVQIQSFGEDDAIEIDTRFGCGWATVQQPTLVDLHAGDEVQVRVFYFSQATFPEAQAEVAIAFDDDIVSTALVDIPTDSDLIAPRVQIERDVPAGSTARFHIGNHGDNSWNLIELSRIFAAPCPEPAGE